jgi:hypothetical protein
MNHAGVTFNVPQNGARLATGFVRNGRHALRFDQKSVHNKSHSTTPANVAPVTGPGDIRKKNKEETDHEKSNEREALHMTRRPRPPRALEEAMLIAKGRGIVQKTESGPERIFDIAIISKIPFAFARVTFAAEILATLEKLADEFKEEIARLRLIARDAAVTAELWIRSRHGTWRFFLVTLDSLVEIDREGKRLFAGSGPAIG